MNTSVTSTNTPEFIATQLPGSQLCSQIIGQTVTNLSGDEIGEVNDLVVSATGQIDAVVVGVGGFLGVGEKEVALPYAAVTVQINADGTSTVRADATSGQIEDASEFNTSSGNKSGFAGKVQAKASELGEKTKDLMGTAGEKTQEMLSEAGEKARDTYKDAKSAVDKRMSSSDDK